MHPTPAADASMHGMWSRRTAFMFAAIGSAVGLGNIWKFPYMTGENGGAVFVLVYLLCVFAIGLPIMMAEITLGRRGRYSPIRTMRRLAQEDGRAPGWQAVGWFGTVAGLMILSFYTVIAGWTVAYLAHSAVGGFQGIDAAGAGAHFAALVGSPLELTGWHTLVVVLVGWVIASGVNRGIEQVTSLMIPSLFAILLLLIGYAALYGDLGRGLSYLFAPDFSQLTGELALKALGQTFFSIGVGIGAIMVYGAYLPRQYSIPEAAGVVVAADTLVALLMGVALFPIVFASGLEPGAGPGLIFQTLVIAFGQMPGGWLIGTLFFLLTFIAALTSAISLLEPAVSWLVDTHGLRRRAATGTCLAVVWAVGLGTVVSFNVGADWTWHGRTFFDWMDYVTSNLLLPAGGILISVYAGWKVREAVLADELGLGRGPFAAWLWMVRVPVPLAVLLVLLSGTGVLGWLRAQLPF